jgi:hypothetical protein
MGGIKVRRREERGGERRRREEEKEVALHCIYIYI